MDVIGSLALERKPCHGATSGCLFSRSGRVGLSWWGAVPNGITASHTVISFLDGVQYPKVNRNTARTLWGVHPTGVRAHEDYSNDYESTRSFNRIDALVRWRRILPRRTDGGRRWEIG